MESTLELPRSEFLPSSAFRLMQWIMRIQDLFITPSKKLDSFGIKNGDLVIDYGCGPGRYLKKASNLVGSTGHVYAVDIHDLAINCACKVKNKKKLDNLSIAKAEGYFVPIQENKADIIYALDMFHMISNPNELLIELHRLIKPDGTLFLEYGHQKASKALLKIKENGRWKVQEERKNLVELKPLFK